MDGNLGWILLMTADLPCRRGRRRLHVRTESTAPASQNGGPSPHLSPLGALYRREFERLSRRHPALEAAACDRLIVVSLAYLFLDTDAAELALAMIEGSSHLFERTDDQIGAYVQPLVALALDVARGTSGDSER